MQGQAMRTGVALRAHGIESTKFGGLSGFLPPADLLR